MHKAIFGLLTVVALVAVGVVIGNRTMMQIEGAAASDRTPVAAVKNKTCGCCSKSEALVAKKSSCCDENVAISTACLRQGALASTSEEETVKTSAKTGSCCASQGTCTETVAVAKKECKADGSCCASGEGSCCSESETTEVKAEKEISTSAGKTGECPCQKAKSEASHQQVD